ncbi:hypothetical protein [Actinophytocola sp. NPDC049390]|uniref:hypothetical protein n=1 Tax=Actinophytocola sp. NPDC049390 TaxID=3363894 RepID=UPI00379E425D
MTGTARPVLAARGRLARLVAVLAVLAGLAVAVGLQCTDGMAMPMAHGATSAGASAPCGSQADMTASHPEASGMPADTGQLAAACPVLGAAVALANADEGSSRSGGLGGVLATCLAFILAVVAAMAVLRPSHFRGVVRMLRPARVAVTRALRPQAPSLAELCLLRT